MLQIDYKKRSKISKKKMSLMLAPNERCPEALTHANRTIKFNSFIINKIIIKESLKVVYR